MSEYYSDIEPLDLKTRVAWLYFMEGLTQDAIAARVGLTRQRVLKIIAGAREDGTVQVRVTTSLSKCIDLERQIEARFDVEQCIVIPSPTNETSLSSLLGSRAGAYVSDALRDGTTIGLGWGHTLQSSLNSISVRGLRGVTVVSLLGGVTRASGVNPSEFAWRFADLIEAESFLLSAPAVLQDAETAATLRRHPGIAEVLERTRMLDMALVSVGTVAPNSTLIRYGMVDREILTEVTRAGAVADLLCQFIDADGQLLNHPLNQRIMAADLSSLARTPKLILVSGGWQKVPSLLAAIRLLHPAVLITDETAAEGMLMSPASANDRNPAKI